MKNNNTAEQFELFENGKLKRKLPKSYNFILGYPDSGTSKSKHHVFNIDIPRLPYENS